MKRKYVLYDAQTNTFLGNYDSMPEVRKMCKIYSNLHDEWIPKLYKRDSHTGRRILQRNFKISVDKQ